MNNATDKTRAEAKPSDCSAIPATGLFGRRCATPVKIGEPARALFGRREVEAA